MGDNGNDLALGYMMGQDSGGNNGNSFGISGVGDLVALLVVAGLFGGGGWGFGGFGGGGGSGLQGMATRADINEGFALQNITSGITGISSGLCDGFHNVTVGMMNGFNGVQTALNGIGHQISDCCCATGRAIDGVNYNMATQFAALNNNLCGISRDIIDNQDANYRALYDFMVQKDLAAKDARIAEQANIISQMNQDLRFGAKLDSAVAELIRRTGHDYPTASYLVQPPSVINFPTNGCGQVQFGNGGNCCSYAA